jgi:hypothetical protein
MFIINYKPKVLSTRFFPDLPELLESTVIQERNVPEKRGKYHQFRIPSRSFWSRVLAGFPGANIKEF